MAGAPSGTGWRCPRHSSRALLQGDPDIAAPKPSGGMVIEFEYRPTDPWPVAAAGFGPSLVPSRPSLGEGDPSAWREIASPRSLSDSSTVARRRSIWPGGNSGAESNSSFPSAPFWPPGRPSLSPLQTTGARTGTRALRVAATERGDHVANRIGRTLTQSIANGSQVTLHAWVRWLRGHPEILLPSADATAVFEVNAYSNRDRLFTNQNPSRAIPAMAPRIAMAATHHPGGMRSAPESVPASLRP